MKHEVSLSLIWKFYEDYSHIGSGVYVNNREMLKLIDNFRINHPFVACNDKTEGKHWDKKMTLFSISMPILKIISITVRAEVGARYGWNYTIKRNNEICNVTLSPFAKAHITASGGAKILFVAEAGAYF